MLAKPQSAKTPGSKIHLANHRKTVAMSTVAPKVDWPRIAKQMAADKQRAEAAIRGDEKARNATTFVHPHSVPAP